MIAGTYAPFRLTAIGGPSGLGLLAFVWRVALAVVATKLFCLGRLDRPSVHAFVLAAACHFSAVLSEVALVGQGLSGNRALVLLHLG